MSASIRSVRGRVSCSWVHTPGKIAVHVTLPGNSDGVVVLHKEQQMSMDDVTVRESGHVVWEKGHFVAGDEGVRGGRIVRAENHPAISFEVGSGHYDFTLTAE